MLRGRKIVLEPGQTATSQWKLLILPIVTVFICGMLLTALKSHDPDFDVFVEKYGKEYASKRELHDRHSIFVENKAKINEFNSMGLSYSLALNGFADLFDEERYLPSVDHEPKEASSHGLHRFFEPFPDKLDWRERGMITDVKNEEECRASWIFATVAATEALAAIAFKTKQHRPRFSEQYFIDCCGNKTEECTEDNPLEVIDCAIKIGFALEEQYPYTGVRGECVQTESVFSLSGVYQLPQGNYTEILEIVNFKPIIVMVDASSFEFQHYSSGVFRHSTCDPTHLNHAMLLIGYDTTAPEPFYILKNSWGQEWGETGYMRLAMDKEDGPGMCGVQRFALAPLMGKLKPK